MVDLDFLDWLFTETKYICYNTWQYKGEMFCYEQLEDVYLHI